MQESAATSHTATTATHKTTFQTRSRILLANRQAPDSHPRRFENHDASSLQIYANGRKILQKERQSRVGSPLHAPERNHRGAYQLTSRYQVTKGHVRRNDYPVFFDSSGKHF